jgi:hypothetical protein
LSSWTDSEKALRPGMINQTSQVWRMSEKYVTTLVEKLLQNLTEAEAKNRLEESYQVLRKVIDSLIYEKAYSEEEDPHYFKELIENLQDAFKYFYESYNIEKHVPDQGSDRIDTMNLQFYDSVARERGLPPQQYVHQAYPPITLLIKMVRNCQKHDPSPPVDHITGKRSFGNIYTISSVVMLSIYAYLEIARAWCDTMEIVNSRRNR